MNKFLNLLSILLLVRANFLSGAKTEDLDPELYMNSTEMVRRWGYESEAYDVETDDGYILTIVRILPKNKSQIKPTPVVFLMHGLECSSDEWIINLPEQSAGFYYSNLGYDVWLGNVRGNLYSRKHKWLNVTDSKYWDFSCTVGNDEPIFVCCQMQGLADSPYVAVAGWQEMAEYDLPAMINKSLEISNATQLYYVGHSQGTLIGFAKFSEDERFAKKIRAMFALAPVYSLEHLEGIMKTTANIIRKYPKVKKVFGKRLFAENDGKIMSFLREVCPRQMVQKFCVNAFFGTGDQGLNHVNTSRVAVYVQHSPGGTSVKNFLHFAQISLAKVAAKFDYGTEENQKIYGNPYPPKLDVSTMNVPVALFYSAIDKLTKPEDIENYLIPLLPNLIGIKKLNIYGHGDFLRGTSAAYDIYREINYYIKHVEKGLSSG